MIVCSCNTITKQDIADTVRDFLRVDEWQLVTVGMVYHALESRGKCCGCFPNAIGVIVETTERWHRELLHSDDVVVPFVARIRAEHERCETVRKLDRLRKLKRAA
ncbi:MAG: (2Fe-2S)-binding protein [Pseudomonadota bacterium]